MVKRKIKLSLIDDYVKIYNIKSFCEVLATNSSESISRVNNLKVLTNKLLQCYEKLLFKFNLMDISFAILKKDLKKLEQNIKNFTFKEFNDIQLKKFDEETKEIQNVLMLKLKQLSFNEMEKSYIIENLIS